MKKILFVIDSLNCGGAEKSLLSLISLLDAKKYEKHLWILHRGGVLEKMVPKDVVIEQEPSYNRWERLKKRFGHLLFYFRWRYLNKKHHHHAELLWRTSGRYFKGLDDSYDIAVAYQQGVPTYIVATKIKARKKLAWINVDIKSAGYNILYNDPFYNKMNWIVCVSELLESIMQNNMPQFTSRIRRVYDIVNPDVVRSLAQEPLPDKIKDKTKGRLVITTVARMAEQKNYPLALETALLLRQRGLDFVWFLVGDGPLLGYIRGMIKEKQLTDCVRALGLRINPYPYIQAADIYVQTSSFEGFGLTIAEAKMLCKPIVSTDFEVVYNQLQNGVNGLISPQDPKSLANAIITLAHDEALQQRFTHALEGSVVGNATSEIQIAEQLFQS